MSRIRLGATAAITILLATSISLYADATCYLPLVIKEPHRSSTATPTATVTATSSPSPTLTQTLQAPCSCVADSKNCSDFSSQAAAQACLDYCWALTGRDVHRLDGDGNGIACESLP